jgi:hypothetical protein
MDDSKQIQYAMGGAAALLLGMAHLYMLKGTEKKDGTT